MKVNAFSFGSISIDGKTYRGDVLIYPNGRVEKRSGGLVMFGSHRITKANLEKVSSAGEKPELIVVGLGTSSAAKVDPEAREWAASEDIEILELPSSDAVDKINDMFETGKKKAAAIIHVTC